MNVDLFGDEVKRDVLLRDKFIEPPFSVLDTKSGKWQNRKRLWKNKGIKSEVGRDAKAFNIGMNANKENGWELEDDHGSGVSIFDPALCEIIYHWFCPEHGQILDPFAGGSVRGIVANFLGYNYTCIDIRAEQVASNIEQGAELLPEGRRPKWITGDSNHVLDIDAGHELKEFDLVFSCPPYADLEVYSDLAGDISNKPYIEFMRLYREIIQKSIKLLKPGCLACFVVGEVRDKNGNYIGFVPDTIRAFEDAGARFYNEIILLNSIATASVRAGGNMKSKKVVKIHQNVLVFKKP